MNNLFPWLVIAVSAFIILFIIIRKFTSLAVLDVENMPEEKENKIKEKIIKERLSRDVSKITGGFKNFWQGMKKNLAFTEKWFSQLKALSEKIKEDRRLAKISKSEKIALFFKQAEELAKEDDDPKALGEAEDKLINIISLDNKNLEAFVSLGNVYYKLKKYLEAKQTLSYALKLLELQEDKKEEAEVYYSLAIINDNLSDIDEAINNIVESLKVEPNNPRFLNALMELAIKKRDKVLAEDSYQKLKEVNPENQRLEEFAALIKEL